MNRVYPIIEPTYSSRSESRRKQAWLSHGVSGCPLGCGTFTLHRHVGSVYTALQLWGIAVEPVFFSWVSKPYLAAMAKPRALEELQWLREHGIDVLITLTEEPPSRQFINQAGLMLVHIPIMDFTAPTQTEFQNGDYSGWLVRGRRDVVQRGDQARQATSTGFD
jgi:hypothetical protein